MAPVIVKGVLEREGATERADLELADGETVAFVGPDAGGRAVLRQLAGLERLPAGQVWIGEQDVTERPAETRGVGLVFRGGALYPHLSVRDNLLFGPKARGGAKAELAQRLSEVTALWRIEPWLAVRPAQLTAEARARVALARAWMQPPKLLLLDEPLAGLDADARLRLRQELARALRTTKQTALVATDDGVEAASLGHRVAVLRAGRLVQLGTPRELQERPLSRIAALCSGTAMNLVERPVEEGRVGLGGASMPAPAAETRVVLGVRPDELTLSPSPEALALRATVVLVEPQGGLAWVTALVSEQPWRLVCDARQAPTESSEIALHLVPQRVRFFRADEAGALLSLESAPPAEGTRAPVEPPSPEPTPEPPSGGRPPEPGRFEEAKIAVAAEIARLNDEREEKPTESFAESALAAEIARTESAAQPQPPAGEPPQEPPPPAEEPPQTAPEPPAEEPPRREPPVEEPPASTPPPVRAEEVPPVEATKSESSGAAQVAPAQAPQALAEEPVPGPASSAA